MTAIFRATVVDFCFPLEHLPSCPQIEMQMFLIQEKKYLSPSCDSKMWKTIHFFEDCHSVRFVQVLWASRNDWETSSMFGHEAKVQNTSDSCVPVQYPFFISFLIF